MESHVLALLQFCLRLYGHRASEPRATLSTHYVSFADRLRCGVYTPVPGHRFYLRPKGRPRRLRCHAPSFRSHARERVVGVLNRDLFPLASPRTCLASHSASFPYRWRRDQNQSHSQARCCRTGPTWSTPCTISHGVMQIHGELQI
jgi:hypothetical protein